MKKYFYGGTYNVIYLMRIPLESHKGLIKVGGTSIDIDHGIQRPNSSVMNEAADKRIQQYTVTAGIPYELLYTEIALIPLEGGDYEGFDDHSVHEVLRRSGIKKKVFDQVNGANEWFYCDLETAKRAITAVKEGRKALSGSEVTVGQSPIQFRPEQREAIDKTLRQFKKGNQMLWNAKMRFGKTLSALQVVKERGDFRRVLILTHRPVVDAGWFEDFGKIFYDSDEYAYGSKTKGDTFVSLEHRARREECRYVYFASMQDLRGSELVGGNFDKNNDIFSTPWDLIIVDEAHEGTQTELGKAVMKELTKEKTKVLRLSGTPFNLLDDFKEEEIYTWDYIMEQRAKAEWDLTHPGDHNPYAGLPRLNIYTYDLGRLMNEFADEDIAFNFREFFRVNDSGEFVHRSHVQDFLDLLTKTDEQSMYPFANTRYRDIFRHTLWMLPGVKSAKALSAMLKNHPVFGLFEIVNVAGDGDEEEANEEALRKVDNAIGEDPDLTRTITLSCGRLTTGVSVKAWTGVFMLSGSFNTAASAYMQTIFRVQTPATINGRVKEDCYVFDFAPDRTLKVLAETAKISTKAGKQSTTDRQQLTEFLNFCPIISYDGSYMRELKTEHMLQQLKRVYVERVVQHGFEDSYLYIDEKLRTLSAQEIEEFADLKSKMGATKASHKSKGITINDQGLTNEEYAEKERLEKKKKSERTEAENKHLEELRKKRELRDNAVSILRGISIRMPLLIYGAELKDENQEITIDNFEHLIDDASWDEFMPDCEYTEIDASGKERKFKRPLLRADFRRFKKYYDPDIFTAAAKRIRAMARAADRLSIEERIERIAAIFNTFHNPDKETVLTPWPVVNMHMSDTLGGYTFYNDGFTEAIEEPRFVDRGDVTADVFTPDSHLLEINSKTGLYPLYLAYNIYRSRLRNAMFSPETLEEHQAIWDAAVADNIFVICKTPMAKAITRRTLLGFRKGKTNMWAPDDLINKIKNQSDLFIKKVHDLVGRNVKIKAIVGNPPYQETLEAGRSLAKQIFPSFIEIGIKLAPNYFSLITPARWFTADAQDNSFPKLREFVRSNNHFSVLVTHNGKNLFPNTELSMVDYFLWESNYSGDVNFIENIGDTSNSLSRPLFEDGLDIIIPQNNIISIIQKIKIHNFTPLNSVTTGRDAFGIVGKNFENRSKSEQFFDSIAVQCAYEQIRFIARSDVKKGLDFLDSYNVFTSKGNGGAGLLTDGKPVAIIGKAFIGSPGMACTDSLIPFGKFSTITEAENLQKYMRTKFLRFCVGILKVSQNLYQNVYAFVPIQNFTEGSDIDWSKSVAEIDAQLYTKYGLSDEEIAFIESMIKPM